MIYFDSFLYDRAMRAYCWFCFFMHIHFLPIISTQQTGSFPIFLNFSSKCFRILRKSKWNACLASTLVMYSRFVLNGNNVRELPYGTWRAFKNNLLYNNYNSICWEHENNILFIIEWSKLCCNIVVFLLTVKIY